MDLAQHLLRQMAFSHATFGPGRRTDGVIDHIGKELKEVKAAATHAERVEEWTDIVILALDGLTRELAYAKDGEPREYPTTVADRVVSEILVKQSVNEARIWPDWRTADPNKAIEHVRGEA